MNEVDPEQQSSDVRARTWPLDLANLSTGLPLEGLRVLDLSRVLAGPLCAMIAGDLGADVIKVESPAGDPVRSLAPPRFGNDATYFLSVNRHRRNVCADLTNPSDYDRVHELFMVADAVVENFLPHQIASLGLLSWREERPDCVWVSVTSAATTGPLARDPSFDLLAQARSGLMSVTGTADGEPTKVGAPVADVVTGLYGAIGLVTGLYARAVGRPGRHFEAPLLESTITILTNQVQGALATHVSPQRLANHHPSIAPYGPIHCCDGDILVAVATDSQFAALVDVLRDLRLTDRIEFATNDVRVTQRSDLCRVLDEICGENTVEFWLERFAGSKVPHAPILDVLEALDQPQIRDGDFVGTVTLPAGELATLKSPLRIDGIRPDIRTAPRRLGQDNEVLGFNSRDE